MRLVYVLGTAVIRVVDGGSGRDSSWPVGAALVSGIPALWVLTAVLPA